METDFKQKIHW